MAVRCFFLAGINYQFREVSLSASAAICVSVMPAFFRNASAPAPGQLAVFSDGAMRILGSGVIGHSNANKYL